MRLPRYMKFENWHQDKNGATADIVIAWWGWPVLAGLAFWNILKERVVAII